MNKKIIALFLSIAPVFGFSDVSQTQLESQVDSIKEIHSEELMSWYEQGVEMTILDARGKKYMNGLCLPNAKWASLRLSDERLRQLIPAIDSLVVVYCSNIECPASSWMTTRLMQLGYTNVYEYPEGIDGWIDLDYPTQDMQLP